VSKRGGTIESVATFWSRALRASEMNRSTSPAGMLVCTMAEDAWAICWKFLSTWVGSSWSSIAAITHFWRAIRE
jgi:hypothetical protein